MKELRGRNALVTGAGSGLGAYIARALADAGVNLALTDLPEASVDGLSAELRTRGVDVKHAPADVTDRDERRRLVAWAEDALGPIDILVNNAGVEFGGNFLETDEEDLELTVAVNLLAVMDLTRLVVPGMLERGGGHVVNMASLAGKMPGPQLASYSATKHGVVGFTAAMRAELGSERVGFSSICPGFVSRVGMYGRLEPYLEGAQSRRHDPSGAGGRGRRPRGSRGPGRGRPDRPRDQADRLPPCDRARDCGPADKAAVGAGVPGACDEGSGAPRCGPGAGPRLDPALQPPRLLQSSYQRKEVVLT